MEAIDEHGCFLCRPDPALIYLVDGPFFAMLGIGPIGEGYSLIATKSHERSMFDLTSDDAERLTRFTASVRNRLRPLYGECTLGEHGRTTLCVGQAAVKYEPHCMHAHRLVFPGLDRLPLAAVAAGAKIQRYETFIEAYRSFDPPGQYLYAESADGSCEVAVMPRPVPRQQLRRLAANLRGESPDNADWVKHPHPDLVDDAKTQLGLE